MARDTKPRRLADDSALAASWLGARLGVGPTGVDLMRRAGRLLGVRRNGSAEYVYPSWQFGPGGEVLPAVPRVIAAARARGITDQRLYAILTMRVGIGGPKRLVDLLREGDEAQVLRALDAAAPR